MELIDEKAYHILAQLYEYDRDVPLEAQVAEQTETGKYTRQKIVFRGIRDELVPGYLAIPKIGKIPCPCVVQLHGFGADKSQWWQEDGYGHCGVLTRELLKTGFAVLALDAQYHGERIANNRCEPPNVFVEEREWAYRYRDMFVQSVVEYRRALDYLKTHSEIDSTRSTVIGYSMGGQMAFILTAIEPRIRATVLCVAPRQPSLATYPVVPANFVQGLGSQPILMLMGRSDPTYTVEQAQQFHDLIPGSQKELVFYDCGHNLSSEYIPKAVNWIVKHAR